MKLLITGSMRVTQVSEKKTLNQKFLINVSIQLFLWPGGMTI